MYVNHKRKIWHLIALASLMGEVCKERHPELPKQRHLCVCVCVCVYVSVIKLLKAKYQKCILSYNSEIITIPSTFQNPKDTYMGL